MRASYINPIKNGIMFVFYMGLPHMKSDKFCNNQVIKIIM